MVTSYFTLLLRYILPYRKSCKHLSVRVCPIDRVYVCLSALLGHVLIQRPSNEACVVHADGIERTVEQRSYFEGSVGRSLCEV